MRPPVSQLIEVTQRTDIIHQDSDDLGVHCHVTSFAVVSTLHPAEASVKAGSQKLESCRFRKSHRAEYVEGYFSEMSLQGSREMQSSEQESDAVNSVDTSTV